MKKQFLNLGKTLNKVEQRGVSGGKSQEKECVSECLTNSDCGSGNCVTFNMTYSCPKDPIVGMCMPAWG